MNLHIPLGKTLHYELLFKLRLGVKLYEIIETLKDELIKIVDDPLLDYPNPPYSLDKNVANDLMAIGELSVIYNQYDAFVKSVHAFSGAFSRRIGLSKAIENYTILEQVSVAFQRLKFQESIIKIRQDVSRTRQKVSRTSELEILFRLFVKYELSRDHVRMAMEHIPDLQNNINKRNEKGFTLLQNYICETKGVEVSVVQNLIDLGANIDIPFTSGQSLLSYLLENMHGDGQDFRQVIELFLYENISPSNNESEVCTVIRQYYMFGAETRCTLDSLLTTGVRMPQSGQFLEPGTYVMDATLHDDVFTSTIPLLIEAGFKYSSSELGSVSELFEDSTATDNSPTSSTESSEEIHVRLAARAWCPHEESINHKHVREYLQRYSLEPRPLMLRCRDVLRAHFPRRKIHRYVSVMDIPNQISDFLLLKPILRRLPNAIKSHNRRYQM